MNNNKFDKLLKEQDVADILSIPVSTLRDWRFRKVGPTYCKIGRHVRYKQSDIDGFVSSRTIKISV